MNRRIGLTGGIGSGKSTVAKLAGELGALVIDTDAIARSLTAPGGAAIPQILQRFGAHIIRPDGGMDREQMRQLAFGNAQVKLDLEAILHPLIGEQTWVQAAGATPGQAIVFDVPLLTESAHWRALVDRVLLVDCEESTQVQRVMQRSGWSAEQVLKVIQAQASRPQRRAIADAIIHNDQVSLAELNSGLRRLWQDGFMTGITGSDTVKQSGTP